MACVVLIPCYREPIDRVAASLDSARAVADRVVIIDDGAQDAALDRLATERVTVLHTTTNGGPSAALNAGMAGLSDDDIICRLDVGDTYHPEPKMRQIAEVASGACRASASPYFDGARGEIRPVAPDWERNIYHDCQFSTVTAVYRRSVWSEIGGFDPTIRWCEDWLFTMRVQAAIGWRIFPEVTCTAGEYPGGHSDVRADPERKRRRDADYAKVARYAMAYGHPERFKHLFDPAWCRKRNVMPLVMPKRKA